MISGFKGLEACHFTEIYVLLCSIKDFSFSFGTFNVKNNIFLLGNAE